MSRDIVLRVFSLTFLCCWYYYVGNKKRHNPDPIAISNVAHCLLPVNLDNIASKQGIYITGYFLCIFFIKLQNNKVC